MGSRKVLSALGATVMVLALGAGSHVALAGHYPGAAPNADSHMLMAFQGGSSCAGEEHVLKIERLRNGTYELSNGGEIVISGYDGKSFDWAIEDDSLDLVDAATVIVKGGPDLIAYFYDDGDDDEDTNLTAPMNPNSGKLYGISHIEFCFDPKD